MLFFSTLPHELIIEVWRYVRDPEAVESFALTSKTIYSLGSSFIEEHNKLKAKFSSIAYSKYDSDIRLADTLRDLLENPRAALYVRKVFIDSWRDSWIGSEEIDPFEGHVPFPEEGMEAFREAVKESPFISKNEVAYWLEDLEIGDECIIISLMMMLLPNLHSLDLFRTGTEEVRLYNTIRRIANPQGTDSLSRLTEVRLWHGYKVGGPNGCDWVHIFSALPSVKSIEAQCIGHDRYPTPLDDCWCCGKEHDFDCYRFTLPPKSSAVTNLTLSDCDIDTESLSGFLERFRALKHFDYHSVFTSVKLSEPLEIVNALIAHAKHSLQSLCLRYSGQHTTCTINLADFQVLNELDIKSDLMLPYKEAPESSQLAYLLPRSIEKIHLRRLHTDVANSVEDNVLLMTIHKAERLPNLKELTVELIPSDNAPNPDKISNMKQNCEDVGVMLNVTIEVVVSMSAPFLGPWARTGW